MRILNSTALFVALMLGCVAPSARAQVTLSRLPDGGLQPQVVVKDGVYHLAYLKGDPKASDVFYARSDDGQKWSAPLRVNSQAGSAIAMGTIRGAHLAVGRGGRVFVAWNGSNTAEPRNANVPEANRKFGASPFLFTRLKTDGSGFEAQRNLMTKTFNLDGGGTLAADSEGRVYVAWHANDAEGQREAGRRVWLVRSADDGATFGAEVPIWGEPTGVCACCQLRLWAGDGGQAVLLYRNAENTVNRDTYALLSADAGATWKGQKIHDWKINACPMSSYALIKSAGALLAAWESDQKVFWSALNATQAANIIAAPGQGDNRKHPNLAVNKAGQVLLVWTEGTGWARGGKLRWQIFDAAGKALADGGGTRDGVPVWSYATALAKPDGGFVVMY